MTIHCDKKETTFEGTLVDYLQDATNILISLRTHLQNTLTKETADTVITYIGKIAFEGDSEKRDELIDSMFNVIITSLAEGEGGVQ